MAARARCARKKASQRAPLEGAREEHAETLEAALTRMEDSIESAQEALDDGRCHLAGAFIDMAYTEYGIALASQADGDATDTLRVHELFRRLKNVDKPFEARCVRVTPIEETSDKEETRSLRRPYFVMKKGLADL